MPDLDYQNSTEQYEDEDADYQNSSESNDEDDDETYVDNSIISFDDHESGVTVCAIHPEGQLIASGANDGRVLLWNRTTTDVIYVHSLDSMIVDVGFSSTGDFLASADCTGMVSVYNVYHEDRYKFKRILAIHVKEEVTWGKWHPKKNIFGFGCADGRVHVRDLDTTDSHVFEYDGHRCEYGVFTPRHMHILTSYSDGTVRIWHAKSEQLILVINLVFFTERVNCLVLLAVNPTSTLYACGDKKGFVHFITDKKYEKTVRVENDAIECMEFCPKSNTKLLAYCTQGGYIHIWNYLTYVKHATCGCGYESDEGYFRMKWLTESKITVAANTGNIYGFDINFGICIYNLTGHVNIIQCFLHVEDNKYIISASQDGTVKIFEIPSNLTFS